METLDIQYDKVAEWLISRRKLKEDWAASLRGIQAKASLARKEQRIEDEDASAFLAKHANDDDFDFFRAEDLFGLLEKSKEGQKKNLIGGYSSPTLKAWKSILDAYRRNNIHLAEAAKTAVQAARYDIPSMKNQAQSCRKQVQDAQRRQSELLKTEVEVKRKFREECERNAIPGIHIRAELQERLRTKLPDILAQAADMIVDRCVAPLEYYCAFIRYTQGKVTDAEVLPTLRFMIANRNACLKDAVHLSDTLRLEWKKVQAESKNKAPADATGGVIDWGVTSGDDAASGGISWGGGDSGGGISWDVPAAGGDAGGGGISWDFAVEDSGGGAGGGAVVADAGGGIDWNALSLDGIDIGASGDAEVGIETTAEENDAESVKCLANSLARAALVDEILELEAFLSHRKWELEQRDAAQGQLVESGNMEVQRSIGEVKSLHKAVDGIVEVLCGKQTQSLLLMESSSGALAHAVSQLEMQRALCERPGRQHAALEKRKAELSEEAESNLREVERLRKDLQRLKTRLEEEIGKLVKAKIRIVGDINTV